MHGGPTLGGVLGLGSKDLVTGCCATILGMEIELRALIADDLPKLGGGESPFDDFGPRRPRSEPPAPTLHETGALAVCDAQEKTLLGDVSWVWRRWGPTPESRNPMIGIWLAPEARGSGAGTQAQRAVVDLFFHRGEPR